MLDAPSLVRYSTAMTCLIQTMSTHNPNVTERLIGRNLLAQANSAAQIWDNVFWVNISVTEKQSKAVDM